MEPTIAMGTKVRVQPIEADWPLGPGELVVLSTGGDAALLLQRVIHVFADGGRKFVIHQGDAPSSQLGLCRREDVVAKVAGVVGDELALPTLNSLDRRDLTRFHRRRIAGRAFAVARSVSGSLGIRENPIVQRAAELYRSVASRLTG